MTENLFELLVSGCSGEVHAAVPPPSKYKKQDVETDGCVRKICRFFRISLIMLLIIHGSHYDERVMNSFIPTR